LNGRLDHIDGRLDHIDGRLDQIDGRLDQIDERVNQLTNTVNAHSQLLLEIIGRFNAVGENLPGPIVLNGPVENDLAAVTGTLVDRVNGIIGALGALGAPIHIIVAAGAVGVPLNGNNQLANGN